MRTERIYPGAADYPPRWAARAQAFRESLGERARQIAYGRSERHRTWLFEPEGASKGLAIFVHGGYWMRFDPSFWSPLAAGMLQHGWTVAMPGYTLCPDVRIAGITAEIGQAIRHVSGLVPGPLRLAGHSAGGHLVTRMVCTNSPLGSLVPKVERVLSISGVHDLRPLMRTEMNKSLRIDLGEANAESPALLMPIEGVRLTCWVGADERPEFVRQNALLANVWTGLGAQTQAYEELGRHHFDVIEGLEHADSVLTAAWLE